MGKSYVENSLKRFLKRKVKITLGLVVAFMITGIVSFGADIDRNDYPLMNEENETIDMGYINAMESLNGLGNGNLTTGEISLEANTAQKIKITEENGNYKISIDMGYINAMESLNGLGNGNLTTGEISLEANTAQKIKITEENGNYKISYVGINNYPHDSLKTVTISKDVLSEKTVNNINKFLNSQNKKYKLITEVLTTDIEENQFVQNNTEKKFVQEVTGTKNIVNNGYILGNYGQRVENGEAVNNGIIMVVSSGQSASKGSGDVINNGLIHVSSSGQTVHQGSAYNYGTIIGQQQLQSTTASMDIVTGAKLYNYGVIKSTDTESSEYRFQEQYIDNKGGEAYNYGLIDGNINLQFANSGRQNALLSNYGTLNVNSENGIAQISHGGKGENYGLIKVKNGLAMKAGYGVTNRGVIHSSGTSEIFTNKTVDNTGIIITNADLSSKVWSKTGVTLNGNYELQNTDTAVAITGNTLDKSSFGDKNIGYINASSKVWSKTGVTLNGNYELQNTDTAVAITGNTLDKSSFGDKNIGYINATNNTNPIKLSGMTAERNENGEITDKKLLGVVADDKITVFESDSNLLLDGIDMTGYLINGGTFIDMKGNSLILSDANITVTEDLTKTNGEKALLLDGIDMTGYLINGGTFIDMKGNSLILSDANITVTEDLTKTNGEKAVAVDLGKTGNLTLMGDSKINGVIKGGASSKLEALAQKDTINTETEGELTFKNVDSENLKEVNYTNVTLTGTKAGSIKSEFTHTSDGKENTITIGEKFVVGDGKGDYTSKDVIVDKSLAGNKVNYIIENLDNIHGNIKLGAGENTVTVTDSKFKNYNGTIDLGSGDSDKFVAEGTGNSVFNYHVQNAETIELNGGTWGDWTNAQGTISFDKITKAENYPKLTLGEKETKINITLGTEDNGSDFAEYIAQNLL